MAKVLKSFEPIADDRSRILILGSMPGPEALRRRQYYGFGGNHFWPILHNLLTGRAIQKRDISYEEKIALLRENHVAVWDVLRSCEREGASDGSIRNMRPNDIPKLLKKYPRIRTIFTNGRLAEKLYRKYFDKVMDKPVFYLPSTSPAHAAMTFKAKERQWRVILKALQNRNPWC